MWWWGGGAEFKSPGQALGLLMSCHSLPPCRTLSVWVATSTSGWQRPRTIDSDIDPYSWMDPSATPQTQPGTGSYSECSWSSGRGARAYSGAGWGSPLLSLPPACACFPWEHNYTAPGARPTAKKWRGFRPPPVLPTGCVRWGPSIDLSEPPFLQL